MSSKNYYCLLEIDRRATLNDIKTAYRKLALEFHPDVNLDKDSEEKFKAIGEAYAVLSDPYKRKMYDQTGATGSTRPGNRAKRPSACGRTMGSYMGKCSGLGACMQRPSWFPKKEENTRLQTETTNKIKA